MSEKTTVRVINTSNHPLPEYKTEQSAGLDLCAHLDAPMEVKPMERVLVPTGLYIELPPGTEGQVRPRSGLALKQGLTVLNSPGTIDADYRGEIRVILINLSGEVQQIAPGDRIAQLVVAKYEQIQWQPTDSLEDTERGAGGFGSTGKQ